MPASNPAKKHFIITFLQLPLLYPRRHFVPTLLLLSSFLSPRRNWGLARVRREGRCVWVGCVDDRDHGGGQGEQWGVGSRLFPRLVAQA